MIYYFLISVFVALSTFSGAWYVQGLRWKENVSTIQAEHKQELDTIKDTANRQFKEASKNHAKALQNAVTKQATLSRDVVASRDALVRLSSATEDTIRASRTSTEACYTAADTLRIVFNDCSKEYEQMGKEAQGHVIDKQTLMDSSSSTGN